MDSFVDLNDGSQALDLSRIRYQLMYVRRCSLYMLARI